MNEYQASDEQIEALANAFFAQSLIGGRMTPRMFTDAITKSPAFQAIVQSARAQAWDDGYTSGHSNAMRRMSDEPTVVRTSNPYRIEVADV